MNKRKQRNASLTEVFETLLLPKFGSRRQPSKAVPRGDRNNLYEGYVCDGLVLNILHRQQSWLKMAGLSRTA